MLTPRHPIIDRAARLAARTICTGLWLTALLGTALIVLGVLFASIASAAPVRWSNPGADRYTGTMAAAMPRYAAILGSDYPAISAAVLAPPSARRWTDLATIKRDSIEGRQSYPPQLASMMFGKDRMAATINRSMWPDSMALGARVYCAAGPLGLLIVSECGNPAVVQCPPRPARSTPPPAAEPPGQADAGGPGLRADLPPLPLFAQPAPQEVRYAQPEAPAPLVLDAQAAPPPISAGGPAFVDLAPLPPIGGIVIFTPAPPVPEPGTAGLLGAGLALIAWRARRRG